MMYAKVIEQVWSIHEAFRQLGFRPDEIFVEPSSLGRLHVRLMSQKKEFRVDIADPVTQPNRFIVEWTTFLGMLRTGAVSQEDLKRIWSRSEISKRREELVRALQAKGFKPPQRAADA